MPIGARCLSPSVRRNLDRRRRRLERSGDLALVRIADGAASPRSRGCVPGALRAIRSGRSPCAASTRRAQANSACAVHALRLDGEALATLLTLNHRDGRRLYLLIGSDYARFGRFSPGLVAYDLLMEEHADRGGRIFDFTIGDEPFKRDFATIPIAMHAITHAPTLRGRVGLLAWRWREARRERYAAAPSTTTPAQDAAA